MSAALLCLSGGTLRTSEAFLTFADALTSLSCGGAEQASSDVVATRVLSALHSPAVALRAPSAVLCFLVVLSRRFARDAMASLSKGPSRAFQRAVCAQLFSPRSGTCLLGPTLGRRARGSRRPFSAFCKDFVCHHSSKCRTLPSEANRSIAICKNCTPFQ